MRCLSLSALLALSVLSLCACSNAELARLGPEPTSFSEQAIGESLLLVGTDPTTLSTDLYLVRASSSQSNTPSIASAESYELDRLTDTAAVDGELLLAGDRLFTDSQPHPVPDRAGNHIALIAVEASPEGMQPIGRVALYDLTSRSMQVSLDVLGIRGVRFTGEGGALVIDRVDASGFSELLLLPSDDLKADPIALYLDDEGSSGGFSQQYAGSIDGSDDFLVMSTHEASGVSSVSRVDAFSGIGTVISADLDGRLTEPSLSRDGRLLAVTLTRLNEDRRFVVVIDVDGAAHRVTDILDADCYWPVWSPTMDEKLSSQLAFVCQDPLSGRPDIGLWSSSSLADVDLAGASDEVGLEPSDYGADLLTAVSQPSIFEGTMDGLVVRSKPQWGPEGRALIFGASTYDQAMAGAGMTLLVLPLGGTAYSIYSGSGTSVDWAHFSAGTDDQSLLLWERSETGLEDSSALADAQPIRIVSIAEPNPIPTFVSLGRDLLVWYPMFLGDNTHFYP